MPGGANGFSFSYRRLSRRLCAAFNMLWYVSMRTFERPCAMALSHFACACATSFLAAFICSSMLYGPVIWFNAFRRTRGGFPRGTRTPSSGKLVLSRIRRSRSRCQNSRRFMLLDLWSILSLRRGLFAGVRCIFLPCPSVYSRLKQILQT